MNQKKLARLYMLRNGMYKILDSHESGRDSSLCE